MSAKDRAAEALRIIQQTANTQGNVTMLRLAEQIANDAALVSLAQAEGWDAAISEAEACGLLHEPFAEELRGRNPYRDSNEGGVVEVGAWVEFGDDGQPLPDPQIAEFQHNAVEMSRKAAIAEARAEEAEFHVEQLRDARDRAERRIEAVEALADQWEQAERDGGPRNYAGSLFGTAARELRATVAPQGARELPIHRTEAGYPNCSTCDGGGCPDCTDPA